MPSPPKIPSGPSNPNYPAREDQVQQLAEAILDYARMLQEHYCTVLPVTVRIGELVRRFDENRHDVIRALVVLKHQGHAMPRIPGVEWKLQSYDTPPHS